MRWLICVAIAAISIAPAKAQRDRDSFEFYRANFEKYLGKEISVRATGAARKDTGELGEVALFQIYTTAPTGISYAYVAVPLEEVRSFAERYASKRNYYFDSDARPLRGKLTKGDVQLQMGNRTTILDSGGLYISFKDAVLPQAPKSPATDARANASAESE